MLRWANEMRGKGQQWLAEDENDASGSALFSSIFSQAQQNLACAVVVTYLDLCHFMECNTEYIEHPWMEMAI